MQGSHTSREFPVLACEIGADRIVAARATRMGSGLEAHSSRKLATSSLTPGLANSNIVRSEALREAITSALRDVAGKARDVIAIVPDASVRVLLLEFDALPSNVEEAINVIRFRARKSVPFNVDDAAVSYDVQRDGKVWRVIPALIPRSVLEEYEDAFADAGFQAGIVLPSILATLGMVSVSGPTLVVKVDASTATLALVNRESLLQVRTFDTNAGDMNELNSHIHSTVVFFEDTYGSKIERILLTGLAVTPGLGNELQQSSGVRVEEVSAGGAAGTAVGESIPHGMLAGVLGVYQA